LMSKKSLKSLDFGLFFDINFEVVYLQYIQ
jgi:hypothetical protein